jgi:acylphosphatase
MIMPPGSANLRVSAVVRGYVQGVGYRLFALREAQRLGLIGWTRNRPDGAVEVVAEGEEPSLRQYLVRLEQGPSEAEVAHVDVQWGPAEGGLAEFGIRV